jgi:hypothetical protein
MMASSENSTIAAMSGVSLTACCGLAASRIAVIQQEVADTNFDFLGYTFRGRLAKGPRGLFVSFSPAISAKAKKAPRPHSPWSCSPADQSNSAYLTKEHPDDPHSCRESQKSATGRRRR